VSIRVVIADDHALVRAGFHALIEAEPGLEVVGEAGDGAEAIELARTAQPDVFLMDIRMPGTDGVAATSQITSQQTAERPAWVLILTAFDLDEYVYEALRWGQRLPAQGHPARPTARRHPDRRGGRRPAGPQRHPQADPRVRPPGTCVSLSGPRRAHRPGTGRAGPGGTGLSNAEIATELFITLATVKSHVSRLLTRLAARDRTQLIVIAYESGFVTPA
jgi:DNA-binding NarL/FixJ family response regulator